MVCGGGPFQCSATDLHKPYASNSLFHTTTFLFQSGNGGGGGGGAILMQFSVNLLDIWFLTNYWGEGGLQGGVIVS